MPISSVLESAQEIPSRAVAQELRACCSSAFLLLHPAGLGVRVCTKSKGEGENEQVREEAVLHLLALILANVSSKI